MENISCILCCWKVNVKKRQNWKKFFCYSPSIIDQHISNLWFLCRLRSIAAHRDHFVRRLSVCACVCLSDSHTFLIVTLVNTIETKPLHISLSNLQDMLTVMRGCTLLILEVRGQRSRSHWTSMEISLWTQ